MLSADGNVCVTFNGEIFNYVELREAMIAARSSLSNRFRHRGHPPALRGEGDRLRRDFNGDFAFAIWDRRRKRLMLARDRMGVRPLYYTSHAGGLYFASEVKALLDSARNRAPSSIPFALDQIFTFWFPLAPAHAVQGHLRAAAGARADRRERQT